MRRGNMRRESMRRGMRRGVIEGGKGGVRVFSFFFLFFCWGHCLVWVGLIKYG